MQRRLPAGGQCLAVLLVAFFVVAAQVLPSLNVLSDQGGRTRRALDTYIDAVTRGNWGGGAGTNRSAETSGADVDASPPPAEGAGGGASGHGVVRPGVGAPAYPQAKANPQNVIMTMIAGNSPARHAVALVQSLRDVDTSADAIVVLVQRGGPGSPECSNCEWRGWGGGL